MFGETTRNNPGRADLVQLWTDRITALPTRLKPGMAGVIECSSAIP